MHAPDALPGPQTRRVLRRYGATGEARRCTPRQTNTKTVPSVGATSAHQSPLNPQIQASGEGGIDSALGAFLASLGPSPEVKSSTACFDASTRRRFAGADLLQDRARSPLATCARWEGGHWGYVEATAPPIHAQWRAERVTSMDWGGARRRERVSGVGGGQQQPYELRPLSKRVLMPPPFTEPSGLSSLRSDRRPTRNVPLR